MNILYSDYATLVHEFTVNATVKAHANDDQWRTEEFAKMRKFFGFRLGRAPDVDEFLDEPARFSSPDGAQTRGWASVRATGCAAARLLPV